MTDDRQIMCGLFDNISEKLCKTDIDSLHQLILDPADISELRSHLKDLLGSFNERSDERTELLLSVILMDIAFDDCTEGDFWPTFWGIAGSNRSLGTETKLNEMFLRTLERYDMPAGEEEFNGPYKNSNIIMMQCFVPKAYAWNLFDYAADIYNHWNHCIPDDHQKEFDQIAEQFRISLGYTDIDSEIYTGGYRFPKPTRKMMSESKTFGKLLISMLECLDDNHHDRNLGILTDVFDDWLYDSYLRRTVKTLATFRYDTEKSELSAVIPRQAIGGVRDPMITVNNESYVQKDYHYKCGSINEFRAHKVILCKYGVKLFDRLKLLLNDKDVTPPGDFERFIVFDKNWIQADTPSDGIYYIIRKPDVIVSTERMCTFVEKEEYCIDAICLEIGDVVTIDDRTFSIENRLSSDIVISSPVRNIVCRSLDREYTLPVYSETPGIVTDATDTVTETLVKGTDIRICRLHARNDHEHVGLRYLLYPGPLPSSLPIVFDVDGERFELSSISNRTEYDLGTGRIDSDTVFYPDLPDRIRLFSSDGKDRFLIAEGNGRSKYYFPSADNSYDISDFKEHILENLNASYSVSISDNGGNTKIFDVETTGDFVCDEKIDTITICRKRPLKASKLFCDVTDGEGSKTLEIGTEPITVDVSDGCSMKIFIKLDNGKYRDITVYERTYNIIEAMDGSQFRIRLKADNLPYDDFFNIKVDGMPVSLSAEIFKPMYYNSTPYDPDVITQQAIARLVPLQRFNLDLREEHLIRASVMIQKKIIDAECGIRDTKILFLLARKFEELRPDWTIKLLNAIVAKDPRNAEAKYLRDYLMKSRK